METKGKIIMETKEKKPLEKVCLICAKGSLEDVYATLVMANGAVMEGIETKVFFTFFFWKKPFFFRRNVIPIEFLFSGCQSFFLLWP